MAEKIIFAQLFQLINRYEFNKCVARHQGNHGVHNFSCWDQYLAMAFAQLTGRDGLRDIEACLHSDRDKLYRMGFRGKVSRSTLAAPFQAPGEIFRLVQLRGSQRKRLSTGCPIEPMAVSLRPMSVRD